VLGAKTTLVLPADSPFLELLTSRMPSAAAAGGVGGDHPTPPGPRATPTPPPAPIDALDDSTATGDQRSDLPAADRQVAREPAQ